MSFNYAEPTETSRTDFQVRHLEQFVKLLDSDNADIRLVTLVSLSRPAIQQAANSVIERLDDQDKLIAEMAAKSLGDVNSEQSIDALLTATGSNHDRVRRQAISSLTALGGKKAVDMLINLLDHDDIWTRSGAAWGLGTLKNSQSIPALLARLRQEMDNNVRSRIIMALGHMGDQAVMPEIIKILDTEDEGIFVESPFDSALYALLLNNSEQALAALYRIVNEGSRWQRRMQAVEAIGRIGTEREIADRMFELLEHNNDTVRTTAAKRLGYLGTETQDLDLRDYIVSSLIDRLQDTGTGYHWSPTVAHMAAKSLYYVGTSEAIQALKNWKPKSEDGSEGNSEA